jgi:hypothetical protein
MRDSADCRSWPWPILACVLAGSSACAGQHVQLLFTPLNEAGGIYRCSPADPSARPEHRSAKCETLGTLPPEVGNTGNTTRVDVPDCESGSYKTITIMDADEDSPTVFVTCGQSAAGGDLRGDDAP